MKPLIIIIPSKGRPEQLKLCIQTLLANSAGFAQVGVALDGDSSWPQSGIDGVSQLWHSNLPMLPSLESAIMSIVTEYEIIGFIGDDVFLNTPGWDEKIVQLMQDSCGIVYGRDGIQNENLPTHPFFSSIIPYLIGYVIPIGMNHYYFDNYMKALGQKIGCLRYVPELDFAHAHHSTGLMPFDETYRQAEQYESNDRKAFNQWLADGAMDVAAERVISYCKRTRTPML